MKKEDYLKEAQGVIEIKPENRFSSIHPRPVPLAKIQPPHRPGPSSSVPPLLLGPATSRDCSMPLPKMQSRTQSNSQL